MEKNEIVTAAVEDFSAEGMGVARVNGQVVFIPGVLPGETCRARILKVTKTHAFGRLEELLTSSPHRVEPVCGCYGKCGGCALMHMDYAQELAFKSGRVTEALRRIGGADVEPVPVHPSPLELGYRNKCIYSVGAAAGRAVTGFYRARSHQVIPVERCPIQTQEADALARALRAWMDETGTEPYDETTRRGVIRRIMARKGFASGQVQTVVVSASEKLPQPETLISKLREAVPSLVSVVLNVNRSAGNTVLAGKMITLWGEDCIHDTLCGLEFKLSPLSFYQVNSAQAERLYEKTLEFAALKKTETALDLYCGTGTITLCLARDAGRVVGAEIVPDAIRDAWENARRNGIENAEFLCADAAKAAEQLRQRGLRPDAVVVDPPRKGLAPEVIETVAEMAPGRVVYVSCDPATLARDVAIFREKGYCLEKAEAFDMFPRTCHVECVTLITRNELTSRTAS